MADEQEQHPVELRTDVPHAARIYDYLLGGKANYAADRAVADQIIAFSPDFRLTARTNRAFMGRAVRYLATKHGIRQFLDLGSGLPTAGNVHEVAAEVADGVRVVYVDIDPIVLVYGDALLRGAGETAVVNGDIRDPQAILNDPKTRALIDLDEPLGLLMVTTLHFVPDEQDPHGIVATYRDAIAPGSFLVLSHLTGDDVDEEARAELTAMSPRSSVALPPTPRTVPDIERFFDGFELLDPGVVPVYQWRPTGIEEVPSQSWARGGVGRKM